VTAVPLYELATITWLKAHETAAFITLAAAAAAMYGTIVDVSFS